MKTIYYFPFFIFLLTTSQAQDITATLQGTGSSYGFSVNDNTPTTLFRVRGDGRVGIGITAPVEMVHVYKFTGSVHPIIESGDSYSGLQLKDGQSGGVTWGLFSGLPEAGDLTIRETGVGNYVTIKKTTGNVGIGYEDPGSAKLAINGNVGIGTTSPLDKLNVNVGSAGYIRLDYDLEGCSGLDMYEDGTRKALLVYDSHPDNEEWSFYAGEVSTKKMVIENTGRVGIGTTSPLEKLEINGGLRLGNTANTNTGTIRWTGTDFEGYDGSSWNSFTLSTGSPWSQSGSDIYYNSGNVGIGTSSPGSNLDVVGTITATGTTTHSHPTTGKNVIIYYDNREGVDIGRIRSYDEDSGETGIYKPLLIDADPLYFNTNSNGSVGIGTPSPTAKVDVNGSTGYDQVRMRRSYTPSATSDTNGNTGDIAWDDDYIYIKTSAGWKRAALTTF